MSVGKYRNIAGKQAWVSKDGQLAGQNGFVAGGDESPAIVYPSPDTVSLFDDFHVQRGTIDGDTGVAGLYFDRRAGDTGGTGTVVSGATNGVYRITMSATLDGNSSAATPNGTATGITQRGLNWKANQGKDVDGRLRFGCRLKASTFTMGSLFMGFTDTVAAGEFPIYDTGATAGILSNASDAVGFLFGERGDTGWVGVSVRADTDQHVILDPVTPTNNKYRTFELEVRRSEGDTGGNVIFYIDGLPKGQIVSPVTSTAALTPCVFVCDVNDTGAAVVDIDWVNVSAPRDTGA